MKVEQALSIAVNGRDLRFSICPWQTVRRMEYKGKPILHWQLDLILTPEDMSKYNPADMSWDLQLMFYGHKKDSSVMKLNKLFPLINQHSASGVWPIWKSANYSPPVVGVTYDEKDLQRGWKYAKVDRGWDYLVAVREEKDGTFELSGCMFAMYK